MIHAFDWAGGREAMIRFGPDRGPIVVMALPLLEEANRTRTFAVTMLRALATKGIAAVLPDLPGTGESERPTSSLDLDDIQAAYGALLASLAKNDRPVVSVAIRSGALLDLPDRVAARWLFAPQDGADLLREWDRIAGAGTMDGLIAGNIVPDRFRDQLARHSATIAGARVVRLSTDPRPADRKIDAAPLWRRSEPGNDPNLAQILADDIADWIATCAA